MGVTGKLVEAGVVLLGLGFFVSLFAAPLGFLLGRLGMLLIGIGLALPVLTVGVVVVVLLAGGVSSQSQSNRSQQRTPTTRQGRRRHGRRTDSTQNRPTDQPSRQPNTAQLDLDVGTIDDYRR